MDWQTVRDPNIGNTYYTPLGEPIRKVDGIARQIMMWYNRTTRDWVVSYADSEGRQVGSSEYVYTRTDAEEHARFLYQQAMDESLSHDVGYEL